MVQREYIVREIKVETLRRIVVECSNESLPALKDKLISHAAKEWGTERRKVLEYLNQLIGEESIFIDGENVWSLDRWLQIEAARKKDYLSMVNVFERQHKLSVDKP